MSRKLFSAFRGLSLLAVTATYLGISAAQEIKPTDNLVTENIPAIPAELADKVLAYTEARGASFFSWHPTQRQMLIGTRFGNSNQVHHVSHPGGARQQITFYREPVGSASFDPSQPDNFIFSRDAGGSEFWQLYRFDQETSNATLLTDGKRSQNGGPVWNNSKEQFAYTSTARNGADRDVWVIDPQKPDSNRILFELAGGGWEFSDWSPNDKQVVLMEYLSINHTKLYLGDVDHGTKELITEDKPGVAYSGAKFSKDGSGIYFTTDAYGEFQQLCYRDLKTKKDTILSGNIDWDVSGFELSPKGDRLAFVTNEAGVSKLYFYYTATKTTEAVQPDSAKWSNVAKQIPNGVIALGEWHEELPEIAITVASATSTSDVYSINVETATIGRWTQSELGGISANNLSDAKLIEWKTFDDRAITGFLYSPPKSFSGKRPVIINIHGGPESQARPTFLGRNNYFISELGIAMIYPNVRGSAGFGKSYLQLDNAEKRFDSVKDIGALLDWIATQPNLDADRVMVTGGSYGGYMTLAVAVEYNERIRCALDVVGISHFGTFLKNTEDYRRDLRRVEYGDERDPKIAEFFEKIAPLNNASKITKPLFIVQGGNDPRVPLSEAEQMAAKVKANGTPLWYLMAKDEGHGFRKKNNADFQFYATVKFVEEFLLK